MDAHIGTDAELQAMIEAPLRGEFTDAQAERLARLDAFLMKTELLATVKRIAELQSRLSAVPAVSPSTPCKPTSPPAQNLPCPGQPLQMSST